MKKNKAMRAAGGLFVATMLTTSIISGTYAKYVTEGSGTDNARVAAFGVEVTASGSMFAKTYYANGTSTQSGGDAITVKSNSAYGDDNVVAPGTKNTDGLAFSISGTPEVAVEVSFKVDTDSIKDIFLEAGTYTDMTTSVKGDRFTFADDYHPVVYTLVTPKADGAGIDTTTGTLSDIAGTLNNLKLRYDPGTDLSNVLDDVKLTWEWAFPENEDAETDKKDTLLGNLAARDYGNFKFAADEVNLPGAANYNLKANVEITVAVTQVD